MIEINLLPGTTSKPRRGGGGGGGGVDFAGAAAGLVSGVKDPFLLGALGRVLLSGALIAGMFWLQPTPPATRR